MYLRLEYCVCVCVCVCTLSTLTLFRIHVCSRMHTSCENFDVNVCENKINLRMQDMRIQDSEKEHEYKICT